MLTSPDNDRSPERAAVDDRRRNPDEITLCVTESGEVTIVDARPQPWRMLVLGFFGSLAAGITSIAATADVGPVGPVVGAVVTVLFVLTLIDDVVKRFCPAVITVGGGRLRVVQPNWTGRTVRDLPAEQVRRIDLAVGRGAAHAWNALVFRLENGRRFSVLQCPNPQQAAAVADVLRSALRVLPAVEPQAEPLTGNASPAQPQPPR